MGSSGTDGALSKFITKKDPTEAAMVIIRDHEHRQMDVLSVINGSKSYFSVCGVGWGIPGTGAQPPICPSVSLGAPTHITTAVLSPTHTLAYTHAAPLLTRVAAVATVTAVSCTTA